MEISKEELQAIIEFAQEQKYSSNPNELLKEIDEKMVRLSENIKIYTDSLEEYKKLRVIILKIVKGD